jgi:fatty-acyl-CoA synthase
MSSASQEPLSIIRGPPLNEQTWLGALTLPGYLRETTDRFGPREALVMHRADGEVERWSYADLWDRSVAVARALIASGVTAHSRVGVLMTNRLEWLAAFFGIGMAGAVTVTLSTFSTPSELEYLLQTSGVSVVLFERKVVKKDFAAILQSLAPEIGRGEPGRLSSLKFPALRRLVVVDDEGGGAVETWESFLARGEATSPALVEATAAAVTRADPGVLYFSSGSTGRSKGVLSAHQAVAIQFWRWPHFMGLRDGVRTLTANGFFWSGNFCQTVAATLGAGGAIVLTPTFDPVQALRLIEAERVTYPVAWPHQWAQLIDAPNWATADLSSLRYVDVNCPLARHPTVSTTHRDPMASYGNTENFTIVSGYNADTPPEISAGNSGEALAGCTIKIIDPETGATVARGERGEIAVKGPTLMLGYLGAPIDETLDAEGFLRCGDGGYIDEGGRLVFEGRINDIIKTGGANVSPVEVDRVLENCPGVKVNCTVGVPHETLGEMVVSCVAPFEGTVLEEEFVRAFLRERLASYKVPRRVLFVSESDLSLTGSAKVRTNALRELAAKRLAAESSPTGSGRALAGT